MIGRSPTGLDKTMRNKYYQLKRTEAYRQHIEATPQDCRELAGWDFKQGEIIGLFFTHYYLLLKRKWRDWDRSAQREYNKKYTYHERCISKTPNNRYFVSVVWSVPDLNSRHKTFDNLKIARWWRDLKVYPDQFMTREKCKEHYAMQQDSLAT